MYVSLKTSLDDSGQNVSYFVGIYMNLIYILNMGFVGGSYAFIFRSWMYLVS